MATPRKPARTPAGKPGKPRTRRPAAPKTAAAARVKASASTKNKPRFTSRMLVLGAVLAVLVVSYASSMRAYLQQRAVSNELTSQIESSSAKIKKLEAEKKRWDSDAYIEVEARKRFGWVMPGETAYQVIGKDGKPLAGSDELTDPSTVTTDPPKTWLAKQYDSLRRADHPPVAKPAPATAIAPDSQ